VVDEFHQEARKSKVPPELTVANDGPRNGLDGKTGRGLGRINVWYLERTTYKNTSKYGLASKLLEEAETIKKLGNLKISLRPNLMALLMAPMACVPASF